MLRKSLKLYFAAMLFVLSTQGVLFAQDAKFRVPLNGPISTLCVFDTKDCYAKGKHHTGVDYSSNNRDILATNAGKIVMIQNDGSSAHGMGNTVVIEHKIINVQGGTETLYSQYSHLQSFVPGLYKDETVTKGLKIGTMGSTGVGSGIHLHFEIKRNNVLGSEPYGYWGYTPTSATNFSYIDPIWIINSNTTAIGNDYAYWEFTGNSNYEGWILMNWAAWSVNGGTLFIDPLGADPHIKSPDIFVDASVLKYLKFSMASNAPDIKGQIFFKTASENAYNEDKRIDFDVQNNGQFKDYSIHVGGHDKWKGKITGVRIDPATNGKSGTNADTIGWHWIRLSQSP